MDTSSESDFDVISKDEVAGFPTISTSNSRVESIQQWLQPTEYMSPGNEYMKHLHSHVPGTGDWLRKSESFHRWHDSDDRGCLWINGVPGSGKSVFAASMAKTLMDEGLPVLFFFFRQIVAMNHHPKYLVRDWLSQLLPHNQTLQLRLKDVAKPVDGIELTELWDVLCQTLETMPKVYCIADALDEMDDNHDDVIERLKELGKRKPANIKLMLTSRPIPRVEEILRDQKVISVKLAPTLIYPDIIKYLESRLRTVEPRLSAAKHEEVKAAICDRANGLFLHARLMTDNLTEGFREGTIIEETLPGSLERLPRNLKELYTSMLAEHVKRSGVTQEQQFTILQCVTHSSRPLRLIELGSMIAWIRKEESLKEGKALVRASCGRLLEILEDESVSVIHHSFTEFLRDHNRKGDSQGFPVLDSAAAHRMLAIICLQYLDSSSVPILAHNDLDNVAKDEDVDVDVDTDEDVDEYDSDCYDDSQYCAEEHKKRHQDVQELKLNHPLLDYATNNLAYHVLNTDPKDVSVFEALNSYLVPTKPAFNLWLLMKWDSYRNEKVTSLHLAVFMGLNAYVDHLITAGAPVDARSADGRTALSYAAEEGLVDIAKLLLEHGADPDADDRIGLKPLHYSATGNHVGVVKLLLATGVHPLTKKTRPTPELMNEFGADDRGETPLQYACSNGHTEIIMEFIKYLDPEDLCRCLAWTARSRKTDAVEAILKTGKAPVNVLVGGTTALMTAAAGFEKDMIEVLLKHGADPNIRCELHQGRTAEISFHSVVKFESDMTTGPTSMHAFAGFFGQHGFYGDRKKGEDCLQLLLGAGGDVNAKTKGGLSPLHYACRQHFGDQWVHEKTKVILADLLLIHGADPNAATDSGATALHEASPNCPGLVDILVRHGANVNARNNDGQTPLQTMIHEAGWKKSKPETFLKLLEHGADCNAVDNYGCTVLHGTFQGMNKIWNAELFKAFIKAGADLNKKNIYGTPPLLLLKEGLSFNHYTNGIHADTEATLFMLVGAGLDLDARDSQGKSILFRLIEREKTTMQGLTTFLKLGCSVVARDYEGATILHHCIRVGVSLQVFQFLVEAGADPTWVDYAGNTIIHEAAKSQYARQDQDYSQKLKAFVDLGVPTDTKNNAGQTPLHLACAWPSDNSNRKLDFLDLLLNGDIGPKSEVNAVDNKGARPIHYAASVSEFHVGRLLRAGADSTLLTYKQISPLHIAARACQSNVIGLLLSEYQKRGSLIHLIDLKDTNTRTALHYSCRSGRPESVRYLLANGANHSLTDRQGRTPLHAVAEFSEEKAYWPSRVDAARIRPAHILITPADILGTDTPAIAHWGRSGTERNVEIIDMLVQAGADLEARAGVSKDNPGMTAMDLAVSTSCTEMVNELRRRGMKARDPFEESMVPLPRGIKEAKLLFGHVYPQSARGRGPGGPTTGSRVNSKSHAAKFERLLQLRDYDLFKEFAKCGADLKAPGENWNETGLHKLVKWGHASLLECFAEEASQVDSAEWMNEKSYPGTLLSHACERELPSLDVMKVLVEKAKVDVNQISNLYGAKTALHWLAFGSHFWNSEALEYLLNNGADIEAVNARGETPLMVAVSAEHPNGFWKEETIRVLLEHGANPNVVDVEGKSCLNKSDRPNVTRMLVQRGADIMVGKPPVLTSAIESMDVETVTVLLEAGANPNLLPRTSQPDLARRSWDYHEPRYPLHEAARPNVKEAPPLGWSRMRTMMTRLLLKYGADPYAAYDDGTNVLQCLIEEHGEIEHFWQLPGINIERQGQGGRTPLISTCYPQVPPHPRIYDRTPKPKATGMPDDALVLLEKGADWSATDDMGRSALHWLCTMPDELDDSHRILFTALAERAVGLIHRRDKDGFKPFQLAVKNSHIWAADALIKLGADPKEADPDGNTALHYLAAELCGDKTKAAKAAERFRKYLSLDVPIESRNKAGETPLFKFISTSWEGTTKVGHSNSAYAMENDISHRKAFSLFANAGADVFVRNNQDETLLHVTAKRWYKTELIERDQRMDMLETFQDLMELGLDPRAEDGRMRTAIDIAVASGHQFIVDLFREKDKN